MAKSLTESAFLPVVHVGQVEVGLTPFHRVSTADTNAASVKATQAALYAIAAFNVNAAVRYLKIYNLAGAPNVGTDVPVLTLAIPGATAGAGFILEAAGLGVQLSLGLAMALTGGMADNDSSGIGAADVVVNLLYA